MPNSDVQLLFGVLGEGALSGDSGRLIQSQIQQIVNAINKKPLKVQIALDAKSINAKALSQLQAKLNAASAKGRFSIKVSNISIDTRAINDFKRQLQAVINTLDLSKGTTVTVNSEGIGEITQQLKNSKTYSEEAAKALAAYNVQMANFKKQSTGIGKGLNSIGLGSTDEEKAEIDELTAAYDRWKTSVEAARLQGAGVGTDRLNALKEEGDAIQRTITAINEKRAAEAAEAAESAKQAKQQVVSAKEVEDARRRAINLITQMESAQKSWSASQFGRSSGYYRDVTDAIGNVRKALSDFDAQGDKSADSVNALNSAVNSAKTTFSGYTNQAKAAGENTKSFSDRVGNLASKFSSWLTISQVIMAAYRALQDMVRAVIDVDTAMTELQKVTDETDATYNAFLDRAVVRAKELGATLADTVTATADFARLGYNIDEASELADAAIVYKNVGDGIQDISEASESIISTMQAFGIEAKDAMGVVDRFNEVGNNFAISSQGVGEALLRSAAALAAGNNTLDESIALITAANTVVQNPDVVGTTMKTLSMYLRAARTEAEAAGESAEGMASSVSELRSELLALTGGRVDIQIDYD